MTKVMAGMDLHCNNVVIGIIDQEGKRLASRRVPCDLNEVVKFLEPYRERLEKAAVESTYNWYWLVDGLQALNYPVVLANPAGMTQYSGIKHADDTHDAFFLAELLRLNILPTGHIYDAQLRPVRDLLRRRLRLVSKRTSLMLSFKSLYTRTTGQEMTQSRLKGLDPEKAQELYTHPANQLIAAIQMEHIGQLNQSISQIEQGVLKCARELPNYARLESLPGVGKILAMTITMEVGDIQRFASAGDFASYCCMVQALRTSNEKNKGANNAKCGNRYLSWAWIEAANFACRYEGPCRKWFDRKAAKCGRVVALKALACKLAKAAWYLMSQGTQYDAHRMFGGAAIQK